MIHWKDVTRAAALTALLTGTAAAQPPERVLSSAVPSPSVLRARFGRAVEGSRTGRSRSSSSGSLTDVSARLTSGMWRVTRRRTRREDQSAPGRTAASRSTIR